MASYSIPSPKTSALFAAQPSHKQNLSSKHRSNSVVVFFHSDLKSKCALVAGSSSRGFQASKKNQNDGMRVLAQLNEVSYLPLLGCTTEIRFYTIFREVCGINQAGGFKRHCGAETKATGLSSPYKKEGSLVTAPAAPMVMMQSPQPQAMFQSQSPPPPQATPASSGPASSAPSPTPAKPKSSHPPLKCPMAGTFYRSPAPGVPPFVKVGDKVKKGQVVCIIEAMKLMNEIEADQSGTVVDILAEDGKPVSLDTPLLVIEP